MNLRRSLSNHQEYYLRQMCLGRLIVVENQDAYEKYGVFYDGKTYPGVQITGRPNGKPRSSPRVLCGGHMYSSITELRQRGILVLEDGRWVPNKAAQRQFGRLPKLSFPPRCVTMNRTRPARVQKDLSDGKLHDVSGSDVSGTV